MSPVSPDCPEPLKTALKGMEGAVQSTRSSLAYAAPEMHDLLWGRLQEQLADILIEHVKCYPGQPGC
jgi:hypothetical protein